MVLFYTTVERCSTHSSNWHLAPGQRVPLSLRLRLPVHVQSGGVGPGPEGLPVRRRSGVYYRKSPRALRTRGRAPACRRLGLRLGAQPRAGPAGAVRPGGHATQPAWRGLQVGNLDLGARPARFCRLCGASSLRKKRRNSRQTGLVDSESPQHDSEGPPQEDDRDSFVSPSRSLGPKLKIGRPSNETRPWPWLLPCLL